MNKIDLYTLVTGCPLVCSDIMRDGKSNIPRGFYTTAEVGDPIDLLVIAINPGQPMETEFGIYSSLSPSRQVITHLEFAGEAFKPPYGECTYPGFVDTKISPNDTVREGGVHGRKATALHAGL
jgi:hypothetical protein